MPDAIRVGAFTVEIRSTAASWLEVGNHFVTTSVNGCYDREKHVIYIRPDASEQIQREVLLHEVLHACCWVAGLGRDSVSGKDEYDEEAWVTRVSTVLLGVLRDNAQLAEFVRAGS